MRGPVYCMCTIGRFLLSALDTCAILFVQSGNLVSQLRCYLQVEKISYIWITFPQNTVESHFSEEIIQTAETKNLFFLEDNQQKTFALQLNRVASRMHSLRVYIVFHMLTWRFSTLCETTCRVLCSFVYAAMWGMLCISSVCKMGVPLITRYFKSLGLVSNHVVFPCRPYVSC